MQFDRLFFARAIPAMAAFALLGLSGHPAQAQTVTGSTNVTLLSPAPTNVSIGAHQSNSNVTAFLEQQSVIFTGTVDISAPGTYGPNGGSTYPANPTTLSNKLVNSFFFYSDPLGSASQSFTGSITFSSQILGLEVFNSSLDNTDGPLGLSTTTYPKGGSRGLESGADTIMLSADGHTVSWNVFNTSTSVDSVRVITASVPEPTAALPMGLMLLTGLVLWRRRPARIGQTA